MTLELSNDPLTLGQAKNRWPREKIAKYAFPQPPPMEGHRLPRPKQEGRDRQRAVHAPSSSPGLPAAGDITVVPSGTLRRPVLRAGGRRVEPLFVYPPDGRQVFKDTTYPWRACGRVVTATAQGAGALVGPRHLLTASHVVNWPNGWLVFQPDYYDGDVFPSSYGTSVYDYERISNPSGEYDVAEDYVVVILNDRLGDSLGWFGTKTYDDSWDGGNYWSHVGYPGDVGGGSRPAWELWFSIKNSWHPGFFETGNGLDIETFASLNHGDSGGPVFGWWPDAPYIVAVVSGEGTLDPVVTDLSSRTANWLGGGSPMPDLVNKARSENP